MTARRESMPLLCAACARWDGEAGCVRYFATFEGAADDEWVEVPAEDFDRLTRLYAQEAVDYACDAVGTTLEQVTLAMQELAVFRRALEEMAPRPAHPGDKEN